MRTLRSRVGATITELMVSTALLSVGAVGLMGSFMGIQKSLQLSKSTTLASTLAQEQMQILKQKVYYQILITTNPAYNTNFAPPIEYDPGYFPPQTVLEGGVSYTRYTMVEVAKEDSGAISILPPSTPDTGMKLVTVTAAWRVGAEWKRLSLRTIVANPDTVTANAIFNGTLRNANTMAPISGALVNVAENLGWRNTSNGAGVYSIGLSPGSFTLGTVVPGYFPAYRSVSIVANETKTEDFNLVPMSSGSVVDGGAVWYNPNLVISQVVASTRQADLNGFAAQYIELFNPTTAPLMINGAVNLNISAPAGCTNAAACLNTALTYVNNSIPARGYYLIANTSSLTVNGVGLTADAYFTDSANLSCATPPNMNLWDLAALPRKKLLIDVDHAGSVWLTDTAGTVIDAVGWNHNAIAAPRYEGAPVGLASAGLADGVQLIRTSSGNFLSSSYGRAYDYGFNNVDFTTAAIQYSAFNAASAAQTVIAGKPALGAVVSATDGLSLATVTYASGYPPVARFALTQVATGTWTVLVSSEGWTLSHDTVTINATGSVFAFPSTMTFLDTANADGYITGRVADVLGNPINPAIPVDPGGMGAVKYASTANGRYLLRVTPGTMDVIANSGVGAAANYVSVSSLGVTVAMGAVRSGVDFLLSQGGRVSGFVTRDGVNPLPGVAVSVIDSAGYARDQPVSGSDGRFTSLNIATGTYTVSPVLDSLESANPKDASVSVVSGGTAFASTFTVSGALGVITGAVMASGQPLRTGALIVVTTATLTGAPPAPPAISTMSLTAAPYYFTSSTEDGTFRLEVRQSTAPAYRVYAYYVTYPGGAPTINALSQTGVQVLAGQTVTGVNFSW